MRLATSCIVAALLLAGCAEEPAVGPEPVQQALDVPASLADVATNATSRSDFLMPVSEDQPVGGFRVTVPKDHAHGVSSDSTIKSYRFTAQLHFDTTPDGASIFVFAGDDLVAKHHMEPVSATTWTAAPLPTDASAAADFSPARIDIRADLVGETLGFVVAVGGLEGDAALAIHFERTFQSGPATPPPVRESQWLDPIGTGTVYEVHRHQEAATPLYLLFGFLGMVETMGDPVVDERLPSWTFPHGGARDGTLEASCALGGWSYAQTLYIYLEGAGTWSHTLSNGDHAAEDQGAYASGAGYGFLVSAVVAGLPIGTAQGDGGSASARIDVVSAQAGPTHAALVEAICLDAPLAVLLGTGAPSSSSLLQGLTTQQAEDLASSLAEAALA